MLSYNSKVTTHALGVLSSYFYGQKTFTNLDIPVMLRDGNFGRQGHYVQRKYWNIGFQHKVDNDGGNR